MIALNTYFFFVIFTAIRTGELYALLAVIPAYWYLINMWYDINNNEE